MSIEKAVKLLKKIESYERFAKVETKILNALLKDMSAQEFMKFREETGY